MPINGLYTKDIAKINWNSEMILAHVRHLKTRRMHHFPLQRAKVRGESAHAVSSFKVEFFSMRFYRIYLSINSSLFKKSAQSRHGRLEDRLVSCAADPDGAFAAVAERRTGGHGHFFVSQ